MRHTIKTAGLNYDWFIDEAKSIVRELEKENPCEHYLLEKITNVQSIFSSIKMEEIRQQKFIEEAEDALY